MVKGRKEKDADGGGPSSEEQESIRESKRLRELAVSRGLLSRSKANPVAPLLPTKTIRKCDGKDIVKKGNRKTKYLFAFPGLVAPVAGGKLGELTHLDSRNPVFCIDFPQGRLKLFGTIVYPKNKYLTMHFAPGRGDIVCEECFESIVVFPDAWWIGTKEENPEELKLPMPSNLQQEKHTEFDFKGGAGRLQSSNVTPEVNQVDTVKHDPQSPEQQFPVDRSQEESSSSMEIFAAENQPVRRSARKSAEKFNYADMLPSSSDSQGSSNSDSDHSDFRRKGRRDRNTNKDNMQSTSSLQPTGATILDKVDDTSAKPAIPKSSENDLESLRESITKDAPKSGLRQATLTSFLSKTEKSKAPIIEVIEIEDSPLKVKSGGNPRNLKRSGRTSRKTLLEDDSNDAQSSEDEKSSSDSGPIKVVGSTGARGRGRGRGRGKSGRPSTLEESEDAQSSADGESNSDSSPIKVVGSTRGRGRGRGRGRSSTPRKSDAKKRESVTEISSSDDDG
ncbi:unnamed protein product [Calypogeia fissa]